MEMIKALTVPLGLCSTSQEGKCFLLCLQRVVENRCMCVEGR